jgi:hypothetical protein
MRLLVVILMVVVSSVSVFGQDWSGETYKYNKIYAGYYVTLAGDTINGYLRHGDKVKNQKNCEFFENEMDRKPLHKFSPKDISAYTVGDKVYRSVNYSGGLMSKPLRFNLVLRDGPITEYIFYSEDGTAEERGFFHKPHDPRNSDPKQLSDFSLKFSKKMSDYVEDYPELAEKVRNKDKGYGLIRILDIIEEYNTWYIEHH